MQKQTIHTLTAVEWFVNTVFGKNGLILYAEIIEEAKAMEKEQIEEAFRIGEINNDSHHYTGRKIHQDQTDYFKKTYAK